MREKKKQKKKKLVISKFASKYLCIYSGTNHEYRFIFIFEGRKNHEYDNDMIWTTKSV